MEDLLDALWFKIAAFFQLLAEGLFQILAPLHALGPIFVITMIGITTVMFTKLMNRLIITKRYVELEKNFKYWLNLRQEAMKCEDREKAKRLARNIDQAQLNRAYYDYFFEGLMLGLIRKVIPIFFMFAFINEYYRTEELTRLFNKGYLFTIPTTSGEPLLVGAVFYYFIVLLCCYITWAIGKRLIKKQKSTVSDTVKIDNTLAAGGSNSMNSVGIIIPSTCTNHNTKYNL